MNLYNVHKHSLGGGGCLLCEIFHFPISYTYKSGGGIGVWTSLAKVLSSLPRRPAHAYDNVYQSLSMYNIKYNSFYIFQDNWFQIQILMNIIKIRSQAQIINVFEYFYSFTRIFYNTEFIDSNINYK